MTWIVSTIVLQPHNMSQDIRQIEVSFSQSLPFDLLVVSLISHQNKVPNAIVFYYNKGPLFDSVFMAPNGLFVPMCL